MVFEKILRYRPRRRPSPWLAEGFSPTARLAERMNVSKTMSPAASPAERIYFSISISPPEAKMDRSRNPGKGSTYLRTALIPLSSHAVTKMMVFEKFIRYPALAVGLKPSARQGEARLRGLER